MKLGVCGGGGGGLEAVSPSPLFPKDAKDSLGSWQLSVVCVYLVGHPHCANKHGNCDLERGRGPPRLHV